MAQTLEGPKRRLGRPTKAKEMQRTLAELGVDPSSIDPKRVLAAIASDANAPASARVAAAKALLPAERGLPSKAEARISKRVRAQRAAAMVGGPGSEWGDDLWPDGRPPRQ